METLWKDLRYGARALARSPAFTLMVVSALGLGIGANTAIFSIVSAVLLRPVALPESERLAAVYLRFSPQNAEYGTLSMADFFDWRARNRAFEEPAAFSSRRFDLIGVGEPEQVAGALVTANFFPTLRAAPALGPGFRPDDDKPGAEAKVVLSDLLWRRRFGARPDVVGRPIDLNGQAYTIAGVMPESLRLPSRSTELWAILPLRPPTRRGPFFYRGIARLKPGATFEQAQTETNAIAREIERANPDSYTRLSMPVVPLREALSRDARPALIVLSGAVVFVLLIAAVNVANLLVARAAARGREMAIRLGLGASRGRLIRQLLTESLLLALAGGAAGLALGEIGIRLLHAWNPGNLPRFDEVRLDGGVLAFTLLISIATGILFGLAPALHATRADLNHLLKEGDRGGAGGRVQRRTQAALVVLEVALSLVLLAGAGLLLRSFVELERVKLGFDAPPETILTLRLSPSAIRFEDPRRAAGFLERLIERVRTLPGVELAAVSDSLPPDRGADFDTFVIQGQTLGPGQLNPAVPVVSISAEFFRALGIPRLRGRPFTERDTADTPPVVIISQSLARRYFPDQDPIGHRLKQSGPGLTALPYREIVGVVGDTKYDGLQNGAGAAYYLPQQQSVSLPTYLVVRAGSAAASLAPQVRREIHAVDKDVVINQVATLDAVIADSAAQPRFRAGLLGVFAGIALLLAALGIHGVIAYSVTQRGHEIGVRTALGAGPGHILRLVLGEGAALAAAGVALGLAGALAITRIMAKLLYATSPRDPLTLAVVSLVLVTVALAASFLPARRAARIDPLVALRHE